MGRLKLAFSPCLAACAGLLVAATAGPAGAATQQLSQKALRLQHAYVELADMMRNGTIDADGVAVLMLTSGTTGPPKRVPLTYATLERVLLDAKYYERGRPPEARLRSGVAIVNSPLVHLGGLFRVLQCINDGRSFVLLERFTVERWHDAVRRHRPRTVSLVPAALRMVLEADLDPADLASIKSVVSGTAPLSPDDADAFFEKYGVPVLVTYAATEFGGSVAGWNLADHEQFWATKRGSVGRTHAGSELRVVDETDGRVLPTGDEGLLEVKAAALAGQLVRLAHQLQDMAAQQVMFPARYARGRRRICRRAAGDAILVRHSPI